MIVTTPSTTTRLARLLKGEGDLAPFAQWSLWMLLALGLSISVQHFGWKASLATMVLVFALPIGVSLLMRTDIGLYIMLLLAFFISIPNRLFEQIPMGILLDVIIVMMLVGVLYRSQYNRDWKLFRTPVSGAILLWAGMNIMELANPFAASRTAWFYVVRPAVGYMMLFFISYATLNTPKKLFTFLYMILALGVFSAGWGIWQANVGYFQWEYNYVLRHDLVHLVFNYGRWRAIGSIGSPAQFGIIMAFLSCISTSLLFTQRGWWPKLLLGFVSATTLMGMVYSGTRSAFVILPIFLLVWVFLSRQKKMYLFLLAGIVGISVLMVVPSNNYHIQRIQSTFKASEDASYQTRARNRKMIAPWILRHPIGGGLGSTGVWGNRFSPGTFLANFPPDSGLVRVAVELGWVGLLFFLFVYYRVLVTGAKKIWAMPPSKYRALATGIVGGISALLIVEWGQEVVGVFPMSILFWMIVAMLFRAIDFSTVSIKPISTAL